jgi:uncharacterized phage-like protein YoqJ
LFRDAGTRDVLLPMIQETYERLEIDVRPWLHNGRDGVIISLPLEKSAMVPMDPDPLTIQALRGKGFHLVVRLSDNRPFDDDHMDRLLSSLAENGVRWIVFAGEAVTGYSAEASRNGLTAMAELMNRYGIGFATIEFLKQEQKGWKKLAYLTRYNVVRLHSILEAESSQPPAVLADRLALAVKDRDIRMIFLNADISRDSLKAAYIQTLDNVFQALYGTDGAVERIQQLGFAIGPAKAFDYPYPSWHKVLKLIVLVGAIALIALTANQFLPRPLHVPVFAVGLAGAAGCYLLSSTLLLQAAALGAAVCAPTLAMICVIRGIRRRETSPAANAAGGGERVVPAVLKLFALAAAVSLTGAVFVVGLLSGVQYMLVLEQFRGVSVLHILPVFLTAVYLFFCSEGLGWREIRERMAGMLRMNIQVGAALLVAFAGLAALYYMTRTGNAGAVSSLEAAARAFLENVLGVRPRTKEFLIAHPLFIFGAYVALKHKKGIVLLVLAAIGQLSMVDTFAHLHTPLWISAVRTLYGLALGALIGLIAVAVWNGLARWWKKWTALSAKF